MSAESLPRWILQFKETFVDTGRIPREYYENLVEAHRLHQMALRGEPITREAAEALLKKAGGFVRMAEESVKGGGRQQ